MPIALPEYSVKKEVAAGAGGDAVGFGAGGWQRMGGDREIGRQLTQGSTIVDLVCVALGEPDVAVGPERDSLGDRVRSGGWGIR